MPSPGPHAVFLSYASQDAAAALRICETLRAAGIEVWFDQSELVGGDAWDAKIRQQIQTCALFVPLISSSTQERLEGYFRLEWKLAAQRTHTMAEEKAFLLPVVIDATRDADAKVPAEFKAVQWTRLPAGETSAAFCERVKTLLGGPEVARVSRPVSSESTGQETRATPQVGRRVPAAAWSIAAIAIVAVIAAFLALQKKEPPNAGAGTRPPTTAAVPATQPDAKSVAVLAFANMSADKEATEYFSDGISEEILNALGRVSGLRVVSRTSSFSFKGKNATATEIGKALNVSHLVEGSIQRAGTRVRISVRLIHTATGEQIWSQRFDFDPKDVFATQDEIASIIAKQLSPDLVATMRPAKSVVPEAHLLVLEGRHFNAPRTPEGFTKAEAAFNKAISIAPLFAEAHAGLAITLVTRASYNDIDGLKPNPGEMERGEREALRAIELDPNLSEGYAALGYGLLNEAKFDEAEHRLREAIARGPNSASVRHTLGLLFSCTGRLDRAIAEHEQVALLDPLWDQNLLNVARMYFWTGKYDLALKSVERAIALRSDIFVPFHGHRGQILLALGRKQEAADEARLVRDHPNLSPRWQFDFVAICILVRTGFQAEASHYAEQLFSKWPAEHYQRGFVLTTLGRFEEAIPHLEKTPAQPVRYLFWDECWDAYREDPRFRELMRKLGRDEHYNVARKTLERLRTK
ncbi:MAG: TIR domain-containing protein [Verrucomicrobia bacterium]|nr:TIR domain-containing protein [Verrucomicrobiota bacterium]